MLRYRPVDGTGPNAFRLLCASRNLTFDRNWDVLLVLDGLPDDAAPNGGPVSEFLRGLPVLAIHPLRAERRRQVVELAREVDTVRFTPPDGFEEVDFHLLGGTNSWPLPQTAERLLVVSPFVTEDAAERLLKIAPRVAILSRAEELDRLPLALLARFDARLVLSPAAVPSSEITDEHEVLRPLIGLHAKLYVAERGSTAVWFSGSANATTAAFGGNVEALVELRGPKRKVGIEQLLGDAENGLSRLLQEHPLATSPTEPTAEEDLQRSVDDLRRSVAATRFTVTVATVTVTVTGGFTLVVECGPLPKLTGGSATIILRPLSLPTGTKLEPGAPVDVEFGPISLDSVTPFLVIEIVARREGTVVQDTFVVRGELVNEPSDRADRLLASLLASRRDVLRYLLFLLADVGGGSPGGWFGDLQRAVEGDAYGDASGGVLELPLLETLLRTVARDPAKLASVQRLVEALGRTEEGQELLPDGFTKVWPVIWQAAKSPAVRP